jgi:mono/diheme cytochrome c family protein
MKRLSIFLLLGASLLLSACNLSLAEDVTPPPEYVAPTPQPTLGPLYPAAAPDLAKGAEIFVTECAPCHGSSGLGDGPMNEQLSVPVAAIGLSAVAQKASPADWYAVVTQGNMVRMMPPFSQKLSDQQRWDVVAYAMSLHGSPEMVSQGQALFKKTCDGCDTRFFRSQENMAALSDDDLISLMLQGSEDFPAFGADLEKDQLYAVAAYLRALSVSETAPTPAPASTTATPASAESYPNPTDTLAGLVRASIAVPGGKLPAGLTVTLRGYDHAMDASGPQETLTLTAVPNADGSLVFENVELPENRILLIETEYKGITYQSELTVVEAGMNGITLAPLTIYDTSSDLTALVVSQGHIFLDVSAGQVQIIEFFGVSNPTQTSVLVPVTTDQMALAQMPEGASSLGFDAQQGQAMPVQAVEGFAMPPSEQEYGLVAGYQMAYSDPLELNLPFTLAMPEGSSLFVPVGVKLEGQGLTDMGQQDVGNGTIYQVYQFGPLEAGSSLTVKIKGQPQAEDNAKEPAGSRQTLVIGAGALGLLLIGVGGWLYLRDRKQTSKLDDENDENQDGEEFENANSVLDAIIALDDLHRGGKIPDEAYQKRRSELKDQFKKLENRE